MLSNAIVVNPVITASVDVENYLDTESQAYTVLQFSRLENPIDRAFQTTSFTLDEKDLLHLAKHRPAPFLLHPLGIRIELPVLKTAFSVFE